MNKPFDLLLGRRTYEIFAAHWPYVKTDEDPFAASMNKAKKYVASKTLKRLDWSNSELIKGDVAKEVKKLKEQDGPDIQVHGSGNLIQTLLKHDLVDELWLKYSPSLLARVSGCLPKAQFRLDSNCLKARLYRTASLSPPMRAPEKSRQDRSNLRSLLRQSSLVEKRLKEEE